jgi:hypothetical protein
VSGFSISASTRRVESRIVPRFLAKYLKVGCRSWTHMGRVVAVLPDGR